MLQVNQGPYFLSDSFTLNPVLVPQKKIVERNVDPLAKLSWVCPALKTAFGDFSLCSVAVLSHVCIREVDQLGLSILAM